MLYAKVVFGIPVEGPFDYTVPGNLRHLLKPGIGVKVNFRAQKILGYVVGLSSNTRIKNLKSILELIDDCPVLDKNMLLLTKKLSDYYCCTYGQAIETALPEAIRKGKFPQKKISAEIEPVWPNLLKKSSEKVLLHDLGGKARWGIYLEKIRQALNNKQSVILLLPDINSVLEAKKIVQSNLGLEPAILHKRQPHQMDEWLKIKESQVNIVIGTRSAIFAPFSNLGLVIIDQEQDSIYKQDQVPHYNAREVAFMRVGLEGAAIILGSICPSLETWQLVKRNGIKYMALPRSSPFPEIKIIDMAAEFYRQRRSIFSEYLKDSINNALNSQTKILLFLNRRGFATFSSCSHCGAILICPRCNINLVYHFKTKILNCHYCNFKMPPPDICPKCNAGYIRYSGVGTEKVESELSRINPYARIKIIDSAREIDLNSADIFISTQSIIKGQLHNFGLIGVLSIDNSLNRIDFRATEKTFNILSSLLNLTNTKIIIQTHLPRHHCFKALIHKDINLFYEEELRQRRQLDFPPKRHIALVKIRGKNEARVKELSLAIFKKLNTYKKAKEIKILSVNPAMPAKLRGNFYWQILISSDSALKISRFLKIHLKKVSHSGIIMTVDVDPI